MLAASPVFGAKPPGNLRPKPRDVCTLAFGQTLPAVASKIAPAAMPQAALDQNRQTPTVHVLALFPFDAQGRGAALRTA